MLDLAIVIKEKVIPKKLFSSFTMFLLVPATEGNPMHGHYKKFRNFTTSLTIVFNLVHSCFSAVIGGAVVGLLCAILCVMFVVYRMRKKDEGSYALDEPKRSPTVNAYAKHPSREFYA